MPRKESTIQLFHQIDPHLQQLVADLPPAALQATGDPEHWAPKEHLAHLTAWQERFLANLRLVLSGAVPTRYENYLEINDQDFPLYQSLTWEQALQENAAVRQELLPILESFTTAQLDQRAFFPWQTERPLWNLILGYCVEHPINHFCAIYTQLGYPHLALRLQEQSAQDLLAIDPADDWQGLVRYNLACQHALNGMKEQALQGLEAALALNPSLTEWSKQDPDFASLRDDPAYLALYPPA